MNQGRYTGAVVLGIAAVVWVTYTFGEMRLAYSSGNWPRADGTVISVSSEFVNREDRRRHTGTGITTPVAFTISYEYLVDGATYTGNRVYAGQSLPVSAFGARELSARYRQAGKVQVYYDPARPDVSVLEPGFDSYFAAMLVVGYFALFVGLFVVRAMFKASAKT